MIGRTLGGYRIVEQVGAGGMATVYKAYDAATDRNVALKILPEYYAHDPTFRERFQREAKAIARLEHLHILPIFGYGEEGGIAYLVMRFMPCGTLADLIKRGPLPLNEASLLLTQVGSALDHAHQRGILHRDVKPSNVALDEHGNAYLTDFGIAKMVEGASKLTGNAIMGTPQYMSPEQCQDASTITAASDQYSLGVILFEMVTGSAPFQAETPVAIILKQLNDPLPPPRALRPDLPERAEQVIFKSLAKNPDHRYPNCSAMAAAFAGSVAAAARPVRPSTATRPAASAAATQKALPDVEAVTARMAQPRTTPAARRGVPVWAIGLVAVVVIAVAAAALLAPGLIAPPAATATQALARPSLTPVVKTAVPAQVIEISGSLPWVDSGVIVSAGAVIHITASGQVTPCSDPSNSLCIPYGPGGMPNSFSPHASNDPAADQYPLPDDPIAALAGRIGDGDPFLVGVEATITATRSGNLFFQVNDRPLTNNSGAFSVRVEIIKE